LIDIISIPFRKKIECGFRLFRNNLMGFKNKLIISEQLIMINVQMR